MIYLNNKLKVLELFGGIGACSKALERLNIEHEVVDYVEIDKYAVKSFNAIHGTNFEPQDITKWDKQIEVDLIMHGSPCQDFSLAGKQAGGDKDSGTRSSLLYETLRIVAKLKPKYVVWENVKNIISKKHRHNFDNYLEQMESLGYTNYYQVLNAKDYGIPQNRERVFTISILDNNEKYKFPNDKIESNLQDFLDKNVNIKTKPSCEKAFNKEYEQIITSDKEIYQCDVKGGYQDCKVGIKVSPTIRANNNCTHILQKFEFPPKQELKLRLKDMLEDEVDEKYYFKKDYLNKKGWFTQNQQTANSFKEDFNIGLFDYSSSDSFAKGKRDYGFRDIMGTIKTILKYGIYDNIDFRIRKLTPKECFRLMGFDDEDFEKASQVNSNSQLYKQAGNSIVVNVLMAIFKELIL